MPALALITFRIKRLHVESKEARSLKKSDKTDLTFSWLTATDKNDTFIRVLTFGVKSNASLAQNRSIPEIDVLIEGKFRLATDAPTNKLEEILLMNGSSILYGTLRGLLAGLSGAFSGGQLVLPTVDMVEIVQGMLKDQQPKSKPKASGSQTSKAANAPKVKSLKSDPGTKKKTR